MQSTAAAFFSRNGFECLKIYDIIASNGTFEAIGKMSVGAIRLLPQGGNAIYHISILVFRKCSEACLIKPYKNKWNNA